ncbi:uncharacterized protein LOC131287103 [Anopheles ziemanni]|uniref:uncharacterized protein LOC131260234 n=1 Tax=Anopheles coustani TaxID=139045 RepID=UPI002659A4BC|nr:uncharacterized protein LOC131260234 [Anopheles coustani]XP_058172105.1 uncharacterized protein LOC131287103 [Anopheles ziemanni]
MTDGENININLRIPFPTKREAEVAFNVLRVDSEPKRSFIGKTLELSNNILVVRIFGEHAKHVRVGLTSFFDSLILCCETLDQFGPPVSEQYTHY